MTSYLVRFVLLLVCGFNMLACSSVDKVHYYKFHQDVPINHPELSYKTTTVWDHVPSVQGFPLKIIYKEKFRGIVSYPYSQYLKLQVKNYGYKTVTCGPIFLPIVPNFGDVFADEKKLDEDANLEFTLSFHSADQFGPEKPTLPDLEIVEPSGKVLKPVTTTSLYGFKTFTFDVKIKNLPWFTLREANFALSDGTTLQIPETKFIMEKELAFNFSIPIAP